MTKHDYINTYACSSANRAYLEKFNKCDYFYCLKIFNSKEIKDGYDNGKTTICPYCGIDSII